MLTVGGLGRAFAAHAFKFVIMGGDEQGEDRVDVLLPLGGGEGGSVGCVTGIGFQLGFLQQFIQAVALGPQCVGFLAGVVEHADEPGVGVDELGVLGLFLGNLLGEVEQRVELGSDLGKSVGELFELLFVEPDGGDDAGAARDVLLDVVELELEVGQLLLLLPRQREGGVTGGELDGGVGLTVVGEVVLEGFDKVPVEAFDQRGCEFVEAVAEALAVFEVRGEFHEPSPPGRFVEARGKFVGGAALTCFGSGDEKPLRVGQFKVAGHVVLDEHPTPLGSDFVLQEMFVEFCVGRTFADERSHDALDRLANDQLDVVVELLRGGERVVGEPTLEDRGEKVAADTAKRLAGCRATKGYRPCRRACW